VILLHVNKVTLLFVGNLSFFKSVLFCTFAIQKIKTNNIMRIWIGILALLFTGQLHAQDSDTTIYQVVEQQPVFPGCAEKTTEPAGRVQCTNQSLLAFMYGNLVYPEVALRDSLEGTVVLRFVVEKNGRVGKAEVVKDIGGGCGEEALRVLDLLRQADGANWTPGMQKGQIVRTYFTLPIRFKIPEPPKEPEFYLMGTDTIHVKWDTPASYQGGDAAFTADLKSHLKYPTEGLDDCKVGEMEVEILIAKDGSFYLADLLDYSNLGLDFWYEAVAVLNKYLTNWEPAVFQGKKVNTTYAFRIRFDPPGANCVNRIEEFDRAKQLSEEAVTIYESGESEAAIEKWNAAIGLFPENAEFLSYRGQANMEAGNLSEACADFQEVKRILWVTWYEQLFPILCREVKPAETEDSNDE
jgi:TonB family protein